jgi:hypothetical protein
MLKQPGEQMKELRHRLAVFSLGTKPTHLFHAAKTSCEIYALEKDASFLEQGLAHIGKAISLFPENPHYYVTRSELLLFAGNAPEAAAAMETAVTVGAEILAKTGKDSDEHVFAADVNRVQGLFKLHGAEQKQPITLAAELLAKFKATKDVQHLVAALRFAQQGENDRTLAEMYAAWAAHMTELAAHHASLANQ